MGCHKPIPFQRAMVSHRLIPFLRPMGFPRRSHWAPTGSQFPQEHQSTTLSRNQRRSKRGRGGKSTTRYRDLSSRRNTNQQLYPGIKDAPRGGGEAKVRPDIGISVPAGTPINNFIPESKTLQEGAGRQKYDPFDYQEPDTTANLLLRPGGSRLPEAQRNNGNGNFNNDQILQGKVINQQGNFANVNPELNPFKSDPFTTRPNTVRPRPNNNQRPNNQNNQKVVEEFPVNNHFPNN